MRTLLIKPQARLDLLKIWNYIAADNLAVANRVGEELDAAILDLAALPGKGHQRPEIKDSRVRVWAVYSYLIAYRFDDDTITIVRVVHGRRNLRKLIPRRS